MLYHLILIKSAFRIIQNKILSRPCFEQLDHRIVSESLLNKFQSRSYFEELDHRAVSRSSLARDSDLAVCVFVLFYHLPSHSWKITVPPNQKVPEVYL